MPVPRNDDPPGSQPRIERNLAAVLLDIIRRAPARPQPTVAVAQDWHRATFAGVALPVDYYAGNVRDSDVNLPELFGYEVGVGSSPGVHSGSVPAELQEFERRMGGAVAALDPSIPVRHRPATSSELLGVLTLCANAHGEWARIHPFANGKGRTARLWANWCAVRYALPAFVRLRPRPEGLGYSIAAHASMDGDHRPMIVALDGMLRAHVTRTP